MNGVTKCICKLRLNTLYDHSKRASEISDVTVGMKKGHPLAREALIESLAVDHARLLLTTSNTSLDRLPELRMRSSSAFISA